MSSVEFRRYDPDRDHAAMNQIWRDCGWMDDSDEQQVGMQVYVDATEERWVAEVDGTVECVVFGNFGNLQVGSANVRLGCIGAVAASLLMRRQGVAGRLAARVMAELARQGTVASTLGVFDHGYYDKLGFAPGGYDRFVWLDPSRLKVPSLERRPVRLTMDDVEAIHASRHRRLRVNGSVSLDVAGATAHAMRYSKDPVGLGFRDASGELTHFMWFQRNSAEEGPWLCTVQAFQSWAQYMELLSLLKSLGDQVRLVRLYEPSGFHLQPLVERPFRHYGMTKGGRFWEHTEAFTWCQYRIDNVPEAVAAMGPTQPVSFNLRVTDPAASRLPDAAAWRGAGGDYVVHLDAQSRAEVGHEPGLPGLEASVNTLTQWWLGVMPAEVLAARGDFDAPPELLAALNAAVRLAQPVPDWDL